MEEFDELIFLELAGGLGAAFSFLGGGKHVQRRSERAQDIPETKFWKLFGRRKIEMSLNNYKQKIIFLNEIHFFLQRSLADIGVELQERILFASGPKLYKINYLIFLTAKSIKFRTKF